MHASKLGSIYMGNCLCNKNETMPPLHVAILTELSIILSPYYGDFRTNYIIMVVPQ